VEVGAFGALGTFSFLEETTRLLLALVFSIFVKDGSVSGRIGVEFLHVVTTLLCFETLIRLWRLAFIPIIISSRWFRLRGICLSLSLSSSCCVDPLLIIVLLLNQAVTAAGIAGVSCLHLIHIEHRRCGGHVRRGWLIRLSRHLL